MLALGGIHGHAHACLLQRFHLQRMSRVDRSLVRLFSLLAPNLALLVSLGQLISFNESWSVHGCEGESVKDEKHKIKV